MTVAHSRSKALHIRRGALLQSSSLHPNPLEPAKEESQLGFDHGRLNDAPALALSRRAIQHMPRLFVLLKLHRQSEL